MGAEQGKSGLSEIEIIAQESTQHIRNIREIGGDKAWALEMGSFLVRATSILGWMGRRELVAQVYLNMEADLSEIYNNPELAQAFTLGAIKTAELIGFEYKLRHPGQFSEQTEIGAE